MNAVIRFKKLAPEAVIPHYATEESAGLDLTVIEDVILWPHQTKRFRTGLAWSPSAGTKVVGLIKPRSSMFFKGLDCDGTIDADYRGELLLQLRNCSDEKLYIDKGTRVAQLIVVPVTHALVLEAEILPETDRGEGGFGSTGK